MTLPRNTLCCTPLSARHLFSWVVILACLTITIGLFVTVFERFPITNSGIAIDWKGLYRSVQDGQIRYDQGMGLRMPPWNAVLLLPFGFFSMQTGWGLAALTTILLLIASVPRLADKRLYWASVLLLILSTLTLRQIVDGNYEAMILTGVVLIVSGYARSSPLIVAVGILMTLGKPQTVLLPVLGMSVLKTWDRKKIDLLAGLLALVIVPSMLWKGQDWLNNMASTPQRGSIMDVGLLAALNRSGAFADIIILLILILLAALSLYSAWRSRWSFSQEKAAMLVCASLLISPYAAGGSVLTVMAVGVIPLFQKRPLIGGALILLLDATLLFNRPQFVPFVGYMWTGILLVLWGVFNGYIHWKEKSGSLMTSPLTPLPGKKEA